MSRKEAPVPTSGEEAELNKIVLGKELEDFLGEIGLSRYQAKILSDAQIDHLARTRAKLRLREMQRAKDSDTIMVGSREHLERQVGEESARKQEGHVEQEGAYAIENKLKAIRALLRGESTNLFSGASDTDLEKDLESGLSALE